MEEGQGLAYVIFCLITRDYAQYTERRRSIKKVI